MMGTRARSEPLYRQAYHHLRARIASGDLPAGAILPSEVALASELGLSQGTARKALSELERDGLIVRRQGLGSFVNQTTAESALFHFFRIRDDAGNMVVPELLDTDISKVPAMDDDKAAFGPAVDEVFCIQRTRAIEGRPAIRESITVPTKLFPGLAERAPLPNTLYVLFERYYGRAVVRAEERLVAEPATTADANFFGVNEGAPILVVRRRALDLSGAVVERRVSRYHAPGYHYESVLS
ncbi:MAG: GntR family transcriptional regulator [Pseudomonadota bacterium]